MKRLGHLIMQFVTRIFTVSSLNPETFDLERELHTARRTAHLRTREYRNDGF